MNHRSNNNNGIPINLNLTSVDKKEVINNTMPPKGTILTSRNDADHQKVYQSRYKFANEKKIKEITLTKRKNKSISKQDSITQNRPDHDTIEHDYFSKNIILLTSKIYIKEQQVQLLNKNNALKLFEQEKYLPTTILKVCKLVMRTINLVIRILHLA